MFGAKFSVTTPGSLSVGDEVTVTEWGDSENGSAAGLPRTGAGTWRPDHEPLVVRPS